MTNYLNAISLSVFQLFIHSPRNWRVKSETRWGYVFNQGLHLFMSPVEHPYLNISTELYIYLILRFDLRQKIKNISVFKGILLTDVISKICSLLHQKFLVHLFDTVQFSKTALSYLWIA